MKTTVCSPELGISPQSNSGGEVYDREVISNLCSHDVGVLAYLPKNRNYPAQKNLEVSYAPIQTMFPAYIFNFFVYPYLNRTYKKLKFDILRVHSPYFVGPAACRFKKNQPNVPLIASYLHIENQNKLFMLLDKLLIHNYDHIITISEFSKRELIKTFNIEKNRITVAYPGLKKIYKPGYKDPNLLKNYRIGNEKVLLFLGGLKKRKNPSFLLDVFKKLKRSGVLLVFAGDGEMKNSLQNKAKQLGVDDKVRFTGFVDENEKTNHYNLADMVLLPSLKEGFGMIAAEAQGCGKPVVVSDNSSLPETVDHGKTGYLAKTNDCEDWAQKITSLLDNENKRKSFGNNAVRFVTTKFSWEANTKKHLEIFKKLLRR